MTAPGWDPAAEPLGLEGPGVLTTDRIVLWSADRADGPYYLDGIAINIATDFTVAPSKSEIWYTMDVGLVSRNDTRVRCSGADGRCSYPCGLGWIQSTGLPPTVRTWDMIDS